MPFLGRFVKRFADNRWLQANGYIKLVFNRDKYSV
jgi:hypothetical protein